jgi:hypothetical protein
MNIEAKPEGWWVEEGGECKPSYVHTGFGVVEVPAGIDARAISAAPEMLEVLRLIEARLNRWALHLPRGPKGKDADFDSIAAQVRAAIRKAEGE